MTKTSSKVTCHDGRPSQPRDCVGCLVYQVVDPEGIGFRGAPKVGETKGGMHGGYMFVVDLIQPSQVLGSQNGPFLHLSNGNGWLFENKFGERTCVVLSGSCILLESFTTGNIFGVTLLDKKICALPHQSRYIVQKMFCDKKVAEPGSSVCFYSVV